MKYKPIIMNEDKILGLLIGGGLGDALGAPFEFRYSLPIEKFNGKLEYKTVFMNRWKEPYRFYTEIGQITDDTEMMLTIANSLIVNKGEYNEDYTIKQYIEWANDKTTKFVGRNTRKLFKGIKTIRGYRNRVKKKISEASQSNGALMRSAILALLPPDQRLIDCRLTNPHVVCQKVNEIYLEMVALAFKNEKEKMENYLRDVIKTIHTYEIFTELLIAINQALNKELRVISNKETKGWCLHGLYCAIYCIMHFDNYTEAISFVIKQGGDTDTNACIAGALLGAYYGFEMLNKLENHNIEILLNCTTQKGDFPRPKKYTMSSVKQIAHELSLIFKK